MSSPFDNARELLRASITDCFGSNQQVFAADGSPLDVVGYVKEFQHGNHKAYRLLTGSVVPEGACIEHKGKMYSLTVMSPVERSQTKQSQLTHEYILSLGLPERVKNDYSEWASGN